MNEFLVGHPISQSEDFFQHCSKRKIQLTKAQKEAAILLLDNTRLFLSGVGSGKSFLLGLLYEWDFKDV